MHVPVLAAFLILEDLVLGAEPFTSGEAADVDAVDDDLEVEPGSGIVGGHRSSLSARR